MSIRYMMDYHHFPIYSIMALFLGAFIASVCQARTPRRGKAPAEIGRAHV